MKRKLCCGMLVVTLILSLAMPVLAVKDDCGEHDNVWIAPATMTTINGQPDIPAVMPTDVLIGPYFYSYVYNAKTQIDKYKIIATFTHSNKLGTSNDLMTATVTQSTAQGSEWSGSIQFTGEIKAGILGEIEAQGGGSYKSSRLANEAVGYSVTHYVKAGKVGHIDLYYRGYKIGGKLTTWTAFTGDIEGSKRYSTCDVNATVYPSSHLDIYSDAYDSDK